jgi:hypothetical protein
MAKPKRRTVSSSSGGGWEVQKSGASRASSHHDTQAEAQDAAVATFTTKAAGRWCPSAPGGRVPGLARSIDQRGRPSPSFRLFALMPTGIGPTYPDATFGSFGYYLGL